LFTVSKYKTIQLRGHPKSGTAGSVYEHVLIAEKALGRYLPDGVEIHHVDENPANNSPSNLVICPSKAYHKLLHYRARILKMGGNPSTHAHCSTCNLLKPFAEFNAAKSSKSTGVQKQCRQCQRKYQASYTRPSERAQVANV
jgi:hypothetical protein